jgi:hypothetical protein
MGNQMIRTVTGGVVQFKNLIFRDSGLDYQGPIVVHVTPVHFYTYVGKGVIVDKQFGFDYYPDPEEYDYEQVMFTATGNGMLTVSEIVRPIPAPMPPPTWNGDDIISINTYLELIAMEEPVPGNLPFLIAIANRSTITMSPAILAGLSRAYPRIFPKTII